MGVKHILYTFSTVLLLLGMVYMVSNLFKESDKPKLDVVLLKSERLSGLSPGRNVANGDIRMAIKLISELIDECNCGPLLVRLAWHDAGTFDKETHTGGPNASMRFDVERSHGANAGLEIAQDLL